MGSCLVRFLKKPRHSESKLDFSLTSDEYDDESFEPMLRNDSEEIFQRETSTDNSVLGSSNYQNDICYSKSPIIEMHDRGDGVFRKPCCNCICDMHTKCENSVDVDKSNSERSWNVSTTELLIQVEQENSSMAGGNSAWKTENPIRAPNNQEEDVFGLFAGDVPLVPVE